MDLKLLRERTRPEHEATESVVPLMQPGLTRQLYAEVLQRFCDVVTAWDAVAVADAPAELAPLVAERLRAPSAAADVAFFAEMPERGRDLTARSSSALAGEMRTLYQTADESDRRAAFLGAMYVMEGSTLGGQYIASHVEKELHLQPGEATRYFRGYGSQTVPMWRKFQQVLAAVPDEKTDILIESARSMFGIFQRRMAEGLPPGQANLQSGTTQA